MKIIVWPTTINFWMKVLLKVYSESFFSDLQIIVGKNKDWHYANQAEKSGINDMKKCHLCLKDYNSHMSYYPHQLKDTFLRVFCFHCLFNKPTSPKKILSKTSKKVTFLINCSNEVVWYNLQFWQQCLLLLSCKKKRSNFLLFVSGGVSRSCSKVQKSLSTMLLHALWEDFLHCLFWCTSARKRAWKSLMWIMKTQI